MTTTRDEWIRSRQRRRQAISWSAALGIYLVAMLVTMLFSALSIKELSDYSGPVIVRLGSPTGAETARPSAEPQEAAAPAAPQATAQTPAAKPADKPAPASKPVVPTAATPPAAPSMPSTAAAQQPTAPTSAPQPAQPTVVLRGSESGNSYDMTINAGSGMVGRSLYVPIWLYMPVPFVLPASLHDNIPDLAGLPGTAAKRRAVFEKFYEHKADGSWQLKGNRQPEYDARPELWTMLEDTGYDAKTADYKKDRYLRPVVILFKVSAPGSSGKPRLEDVALEGGGSGYDFIDQAVLYGFRKAEFSNSGTSSITGRFTYRF